MRWLSDGQAAWLFLRPIKIGGTTAVVPDPGEMRKLADQNLGLLRRLRAAMNAGAL